MHITFKHKIHTPVGWKILNCMCLWVISAESLIFHPGVTQVIYNYYPSICNKFKSYYNSPG